LAGRAIVSSAGLCLRHQGPWADFAVPRQVQAHSPSLQLPIASSTPLFPKIAPQTAANPLPVTLSQLPCWKHLTPETYRARVAKLIHQIEATAAAERAKRGVEPLGVEKILAQDPETRPEKLDRSPAPFVHAATRKIRKELWEAYGWFVAAYREAADRLRNGDRNAAFPPGSFPPHLPFVPA
jgi:hypothetical protein